MHKFFRIFAFGMLVFFAGAPAQTSSAAEMSIAIVVNDDAISLGDLNDRMLLIIASSRLPNTQDTRQKLAPQVIRNLIEEQLKLQEATRLELKIAQGEINEGFATIAKQNQFEPDQFRAVLKKSGINIGTMERQIRAQIAWSKVIQKSLRSQVSISDADIDAVIERLQNNEGKTEFLVSEILLPVEKAADDAKVRGFAQNLTQQVRAKKAPFFRLAQQFSKAPGALQGGDLGWVQQGQMDSELDAAIAGLEKGGVSDPVRTLSGYHIFLLREKRVISADTLPTREQVERGLGRERLERLQRRHLQELRASAFIENRLGS